MDYFHLRRSVTIPSDTKEERANGLRIALRRQSNRARPAEHRSLAARRCSRLLNFQTGVSNLRGVRLQKVRKKPPKSNRNIYIDKKEKDRRRRGRPAQARPGAHTRGRQPEGVPLACLVRHDIEIGLPFFRRHHHLWRMKNIYEMLENETYVREHQFMALARRFGYHWGMWDIHRQTILKRYPSFFFDHIGQRSSTKGSACGGISFD
jgi:hypothetical protein